jgi:Beta-galactosidase/beta-glucuronidase
MKETGGAEEARIESRWAASVNSERPLPEYPRPSLARAEWLCLNGRWDYALAPIGDAPKAYDGTIIVPFPIESRLSGVERPLEADAALWYRRSFSVPTAWKGRRILLHIGAVDWEARVQVNGAQVAIHRGGYSSFSCDITQRLVAGPNELVVEVRDPTDKGFQLRGKQVREPRGIWYTASSGIWRAVWIEAVPEASVARVLAQVKPGTEASEGRLLVTLSLALPEGSQDPRRVRVEARDGERTLSSGEAMSRGDQALVELAVPSPKLWSPESPFLYKLSIELEDGETGSCDKIESYAALRTISLGIAPDGHRRMLLNGQSYFNNAVLDQGFWPEGIYTAPTDEALASDIIQAKELGFNTIRKHVKVECDRWYWHCDRIGMLVWQDIPSGGSPVHPLYSIALGFAGYSLRDDRLYGRLGRGSAEGRDEYEEEAAEIYASLEGFPCIAAWVPFNEGWGQFDSVRTTRELAARDPSRLVDAASGWYDRGGGHFASRHDYSRRPSMPARIGERAAALTEFGGLTLRVEEHSTQDRRQFGYVRASSADDLAERYEALIDRLCELAKEGLAASVYTQISDVEIERNGLLTYDRKLVKAKAERIRAANERLVAAAKAAAETARSQA